MPWYICSPWHYFSPSSNFRRKPVIVNVIRVCVIEVVPCWCFAGFFTVFWYDAKSEQSVWPAQILLFIKHLTTDYLLFHALWILRFCIFFFIVSVWLHMANVLFAVICVTGLWTTQHWVRNLVRFVSRGAWKLRVLWTRKRWWKKLEKCWNRIAVTMNSVKISCYSVAMAMPLTPITCSGKWRFANFLDCRWTGFALNASPGHRLTSRTLRLRLQTSWSCDGIVWFWMLRFAKPVENGQITGNDLGGETLSPRIQR